MGPMGEPPPGRVLVVDDDVGRRDAIARALRDAGFGVDEAAGGEAAVARVSPVTDVVIVDAHELCRRIKANPSTAGVLVLELAAPDTEPDGADAYLVHPVEPVELIASVRALHRLRSAERSGSHLTHQRDLLLGALGHDLRSPLQVIRLAAELLRATSGLDPRQLRAIGQIDTGVDRMSKLIEQLLFFAQHEAIGIQVDRRPTHLADLAADVVRDARVREPDRELAIESSIDRAVSIDPDRIAQLLDNLVANALRHGTGAVTLRLAATADATTIEIHNRGAPIPAELLPTLFDPFRQAGGKKGGVGLGLYVVERIVAAHGGSVEVVSTEVDGTTFRISLPAA
jgi:signal transduction histidine kinase